VRRWHDAGVNDKPATVLALGTAQTLAWASSYYVPAVLAAPMARDLGVATPTVFAAFSAALLVSAALGPHAGQAIDRWGGRVVLIGTNLVFAAGLAALAMATGPWTLFAAWAILGVGMGSGLYEAAFAALVRLYGTDSRGAITGITLIAGFASTVGWPLSALLESHVGWRGACVAWAALHLVVGIPLNAMIPRAGPAVAPHRAEAPATTSVGQTPQRASTLLAIAFAATWFVSTAMAAHLPELLQASGATLAVAVGVGALVGPAQVAGRVLEFGVLRRVHPLLSARLAALLHPLGAVALSVVGAPAAAVFAILHGAGNGILTIAKGTLPLVLFGPQGYGHRQGWLMVPARIAQALAPWLFGVLLERWGAHAIWLSAALGVLTFTSLALLRASAAQAGRAAGASPSEAPIA
jgi:predicted MFS family arabinose efflux permease